jgi:hypothetical protein
VAKREARRGPVGMAFNFQIHWAEHATSALRAIFALSAWRDVPWPTGAGSQAVEARGRTSW